MKTHNKFNLGILLFFLIIFSLSQVGCGLLDKSDDNDEIDPILKENVDVLITTQEDIFNAFEIELQNADTITAINNVVQYFSTSANITSIEATPDGMTIKYASGMMGIILIDPGEEEGGLVEKTINQTRSEVTPAQASALLLYSDYANIRDYGEKVEDAYFDEFPKPEYSVEIARGPQVNLDRLTRLEGYGVIQFFSHGVLYSKSPELSGFMTGELFDKFNYNTILAFQDDFQGGHVGFVTKVVDNNLQHRFFVTPDFIKKHNSFHQDSTLILGGFCYSGVGDWGDILTNAGALSYLGYDWRIGGAEWATWTSDMIEKMCDTSKIDPYTIGNWLDEKNRVYECTKPDPKNIYTDIVFSGNRNTALWSRPDSVEILRVDVDLYIGDATFKFVMDTNVSYGSGAHRAFISSREGSNTFENDVWTTTFDKTWFGTTYSGNMEIHFYGNSADVTLTRVSKNSGIVETYVINKTNVPRDQILSNTSKTVYGETGANVCGNLSTSYSRVGATVTETLESYQCDASSYFKIEVVYM